jgi:hypothetical protein
MGLNCRCFRPDSHTGTGTEFKQGSDVSNYWASPIMCKLGGLMDFKEALSPYGSDASNWFGLFSTLLFVLLIAVGLIRILQGFIVQDSNVIPETEKMLELPERTTRSSLHETIE